MIDDRALERWAQLHDMEKCIDNDPDWVTVKAARQKKAAVRLASNDAQKEFLLVPLADSGMNVVEDMQLRIIGWKGRANYAHKPILFQTMTPNATSVHATIPRFLDVRDSGPDATTRVSVPTVIKATPHIGLLARTSQIVGIDQPANKFAAFLEAA